MHILTTPDHIDLIDHKNADAFIQSPGLHIIRQPDQTYYFNQAIALTSLHTLPTRYEFIHANDQIPAGFNTTNHLGVFAIVATLIAIKQHPAKLTISHGHYLAALISIMQQLGAPRQNNITWASRGILQVNQINNRMQQLPLWPDPNALLTTSSLTHPKRMRPAPSGAPQGIFSHTPLYTTNSGYVDGAVTSIIKGPNLITVITPPKTPPAAVTFGLGKHQRPGHHLIQTSPHEASWIARHLKPGVINLTGTDAAKLERQLNNDRIENRFLMSMPTLHGLSHVTQSGLGHPLVSAGPLPVTAQTPPPGRRSKDLRCSEGSYLHLSGAFQPEDRQALLRLPGVTEVHAASEGIVLRSGHPPMRALTILPARCAHLLQRPIPEAKSWSATPAHTRK